MLQGIDGLCPKLLSKWSSFKPISSVKVMIPQKRIMWLNYNGWANGGSSWQSLCLRSLMFAEWWIYVLMQLQWNTVTESNVSHNNINAPFLLHKNSVFLSVKFTVNIVLETSVPLSIRFRVIIFISEIAELIE